jgi:Helix-turn-helix domain
MTEIEQQRKIRHRMAVLRHAQELTGSVSKTCRYYGISRPTFYKWLHRYEEHGEQGLRDGSSRPHHVPHATKAEVVGKIVYLRQSYHFGPDKIAMYLARYPRHHHQPVGGLADLKAPGDEPLAGLSSATCATKSAGHATKSRYPGTKSRWM